MNVVAVGGGVLLLVLASRVSCQLVQLRRDLASANAGIRKGIDELHAATEYSREEQVRVLVDVERAATQASNEVRIAADAVRAVVARLAERDEVSTHVVG